MRLKGQSFAILLTCITPLVVVPKISAQTNSNAPEAGAEPRDESAGAAVSRVLPKPEPSCAHPYTNTRPYVNTVAHSECDEVEAQESDKVAHLRRAAQHLKAAGKPELARKVAREALLEAKLEKIRKLQAEVKELRTKTATDQAVVLQVKIMELQVSKMRELGLDFQTAEGIGFQQLTGGPLIKLEVINGLIEALRKHELVKVLAEPSLVTVSGRPATFQSGGEFPITVPQSLGTQTVEYRQFGTRLDCLVDELDNGRIRLELRATVSEIDTSRSVMIQHTSVPGLRTRQIDTAVELDAGQTIVLSGMTQARA